MNKKRAKTAIGLYDYSGVSPSVEEIRAFYSVISEIYRKLSLSLTHIAVNGQAFPEKIVVHTDRFRKKLLSNDLHGVRGISLYASPNGSHEFTFDWAASAEFGSFPQRETFLALAVNTQELGIKLLLAEHSDILHDLRSWEHGIAFEEKSGKDPIDYILGINDGHLSVDEEERLNHWYELHLEDRASLLRDVFPVLWLNRKQLELDAPNSSTVHEYLLSKGATEEGCGSLMKFTLPSEKIEEIRSGLRQTGAIPF